MYVVNESAAATMIVSYQRKGKNWNITQTSCILLIHLLWLGKSSLIKIAFGTLIMSSILIPIVGNGVISFEGGSDCHTYPVWTSPIMPPIKFFLLLIPKMLSIRMINGQ